MRSSTHPDWGLQVQTLDELRTAVETSRLRHPGIKVWVAEGLEEAAQAVWQEFSQAVTKGPFA